MHSSSTYGYGEVFDPVGAGAQSPGILCSGDARDARTQVAADFDHSESVRLVEYRRDDHSRPIFLNSLWLRDACRCPQCVDPSTAQKRFDTADLPLRPAVKSQRVTKEGRLEVEWEVGPEESLMGITEPHKSVYEQRELDHQPYDNRFESNHDVWTHCLWDRAHIESQRERLTFGWDEILHHPPALKSAVLALLRIGLIFVRGAAHRSESVRELAERFGPVRETFYGATWDVRAKAEAENVAYTSGALDFHQDLLYMAEPPTLQVLHCLQPATAGGVSRFSDAARAFEELQRDDPDMARVFANCPVTYQYRNRGHWYRFRRKHLESGLWQRPSVKGHVYPCTYQSVNWSPPFQGSLDGFTKVTKSESTAHMDVERMGKYIQARKLFRERLTRPDAVYETTMASGDCVVFHNRRVVHARTAFEVEPNRTARWLRGCYVDGDALRSKYRVQMEG